MIDFKSVRDVCNEQREDWRNQSRAMPWIRLFYNDPNGVGAGGENGLLLKGEIRDFLSIEAPWTKNKAATCKLEMRIDHHISKFLIALPDDPDYKKNTVLIVDHMRSRLRWSGLLTNWSIERAADGLYKMVITFTDDLQFLDWTLGPPNPALPIPVFQFPRVLPIVGPSNWAIAILLLMNIVRNEMNWITLPDDPFDLLSWFESFDCTTWQCFVKAPSFLSDSSLWTILATRMNKLSDVISDALEDSQQVLRYRRILTVDGETPAQYGLSWLPSCRNGALVLWVEDESGFYDSEGTATGGGIFGGLVRSIVDWADGFIEDGTAFIDDDEIIWPDEYYTPGFLTDLPFLAALTKPVFPWVVCRDSKWSQMTTAKLTWAPAKCGSAIVGGDNPYADALIELAITAAGDILGYFALAGFSSAGDIAATVIMPFLNGTVAAWLQWKHFKRVQNLGWVHLWEVYGQGAENNSWSLSAIAALRAAFLSTRSETSHQFNMSGSGPIYPGVHFNLGQRVGSTMEHVSNKIFVAQVEEMTLSYDLTGDTGTEWNITVGTGKAAMTHGERMARLMAKALDTLSSIGVHLIS